MGNELDIKGNQERDQIVGQQLLLKLSRTPENWTIVPPYREISENRIFLVEGLSTRVDMQGREYEVRIEHYSDVDGEYGIDYRIRVGQPEADTVNTTTYFPKTGTTVATALHLLYGGLYVDAERMKRTRTEADLRRELEDALSSDS